MRFLIIIWINDIFEYSSIFYPKYNYLKNFEIKDNDTNINILKMNIFNGIYNKISVLNFIFRNKNTNKSNENDNDIFFLWMEFFVMKKVFFYIWNFLL